MPKTIEEVFGAMGIETDAPSEEELKHYGVPGMKWGRRKSRSSGGAAPKRTVKDMSDDELRTAIGRLKLEKEFTQLATPAPSAGKKIVQEILANAAKQQATAYLNKGMAEGGDLIKTAMAANKKK